MRALRGTIVALVGGLAVSACVPPSAQLYQWGSYDAALYNHYKHPEDREGFVTSLKTLILEAEQSGKKVPPGCYAEYGYALLEQGQREAAIEYFTKERNLWPESTVFMEKMIQNARRQAATPVAGAGGVVEGGAK